MSDTLSSRPTGAPAAARHESDPDGRPGEHRAKGDGAPPAAASPRRVARDTGQELATGGGEGAGPGAPDGLARLALGTHEAVMVTDPEGRIVLVNDAFTALTGYGAHEVLGAPASILRSGHHDEGFYRNMWRSLKYEGRWEGELWNRGRGGRRWVAWLRITALTDEDGRTTHYVAIQSDFTARHRDRRARARALAEEQAMQAILRSALEVSELDRFLEGAARTLVEAAPWLGPAAGAGVFLLEGQASSAGEPGAGVLRLAAPAHLPAPFRDLCARVPLSDCLCGRAAAGGEVQFGLPDDERHGRRYAGMPACGSWSVPIESAGELLGVLVVYAGRRQRQPREHESFLIRAAEAIGLGIRSRRALVEQVDRVTFHDPLTGLANRDALMGRLEADLEAGDEPQGLPGAAGRIGKRSRCGVLLHMDLDRFALINNALGSAAGDRVLRRIASRLRNLLDRWSPPAWTLARIGGDEFIVWLPGLADTPEGCSARVQTLVDALQETVTGTADPEETQHFLTASLGVTIVEPGTADAETVLKQASAALHLAKSRGRAQLVFHQSGVQAEAESRLRLERALHQAIGTPEMCLHYQPQTDAAGRLRGAEALLRWTHPEEGPVSPGRFIPIAESSGLILELGRWTLEEACRQVRAWQELCARPGTALAGPPRVSVNVSPLEFQREDYVREVAAIIEASGVDPGQITLELTEGIVMGGGEESVGKMRALRELGVQLALDDFGTGYSSLSYLKRLPIHELKIDQSFVRGLPDNPADVTIVETILAMAERLGFETVAEGVETPLQRDFLAARGCTRHQGFLFGHPVPGEAFARRWLCPRTAAAPGPV